MALGAVSFVFTAAASCIAPDGAEMLFNKAPTMLFMAGGIFAWFSEREDHLKMPGMAVRVIGKYGFSILLIHWYILHYVTEERLGLFASSFGVIGGTALAERHDPVHAHVAVRQRAGLVEAQHVHMRQRLQ